MEGGGASMANPFVHVELNTQDLDKAKKFYGQLFDWKLKDEEMGATGRYTMIDPGHGTGGGMLKHPDPGSPSMWLAYVDVDDVAAYTKKAVALPPRAAALFRAAARARLVVSAPHDQPPRAPPARGPPGALREEEEGGGGGARPPAVLRALESEAHGQRLHRARDADVGEAP